ncbi:MAG: hypothetical protein ABI658_04350 [Acidimicrobiales bacterium]
MSARGTDLGVLRVVAERSGLLQTFRAAHAISEAGASLAVSADEAPRYRWLSRYFDCRYEIDADAPDLEVVIDHSRPQVRIGHMERPLLYAHAVFDAYRAQWSSDRPLRYSFAGFGTPARRLAIKRWAATNGVRMPNALRRGSSELDLRYSRTGREWPEKAWDPGYVAALGRAQFALCPSGDFVWTYRFFEAAAAGALPIIEHFCDLYDGFVFHTFADPACSFEWTATAAKHNAALVRDRLTVPTADLAEAIRAELQLHQ